MTRPLARLARRLPPVLLAEPWALWVALACLLSGVGYLTGVTPSSLRQALPQASVVLWYVSLAGGGGLALAGILARRPRLEAAGLWPLATAAAVYAASIVDVFGVRGAVTAALIAAFSGAAFSRLLAIYALRAVFREVVERGDDAP